MPRPTQSLPPREQEICERVHFARKEIIKWTQPALAKEIGVTQNQIAGIEYKRAPLRLGVAKFFCENFNISQRWLALGVLPMRPRYDVSMEYSVNVNKDSLFSWYFDNFQDHITGMIEGVMIGRVGEANFRTGRYAEGALAEFEEVEDPPAMAVPFFMQKAVEYRFKSLPDDLKIEYGLELLRLNREFQRKHSKQLAETIALPSKQKPEQLLTMSLKTLTSKDVKPVLPKLIERLKNATAQRGQKVALAKWLGVHRQSVTDWLSGKQKPGGEITLRLLHWVEQQERQK